MLSKLFSCCVPDRHNTDHNEFIFQTNSDHTPPQKQIDVSPYLYRNPYVDTKMYVDKQTVPWTLKNHKIVEFGRLTASTANSTGTSTPSSPVLDLFNKSKSIYKRVQTSFQKKSTQTTFPHSPSSSPEKEGPRSHSFVEKNPKTTFFETPCNKRYGHNASFDLEEQDNPLRPSAFQYTFSDCSTPRKPDEEIPQYARNIQPTSRFSDPTSINPQAIENKQLTPLFSQSLLFAEDRMTKRMTPNKNFIASKQHDEDVFDEEFDEVSPSIEEKDAMRKRPLLFDQFDPEEIHFDSYSHSGNTTFSNELEDSDTVVIQPLWKSPSFSLPPEIQCKTEETIDTTPARRGSDISSETFFTSQFWKWSAPLLTTEKRKIENLWRQSQKEQKEICHLKISLEKALVEQDMATLETSLVSALSSQAIQRHITSVPIENIIHRIKIEKDGKLQRAFCLTAVQTFLEKKMELYETVQGIIQNPFMEDGERVRQLKQAVKTEQEVNEKFERQMKRERNSVIYRYEEAVKTTKESYKRAPSRCKTPEMAEKITQYCKTPPNNYDQLLSNIKHMKSLYAALNQQNHKYGGKRIDSFGTQLTFKA